MLEARSMFRKIWDSHTVIRDEASGNRGQTTFSEAGNRVRYSPKTRKRGLTPISPEVINRLHGAIAAGLTRPAVRARFAKQGAEVVASPSAEFAGFIKREIVKWTRVIKDAGATVD